MKNLKFGLIVCGVLGVIGAFLPMVKMGSASISLWELKGLPGGAGQVYLTLAGFIVGIVMGGLALKGGLKRWQSIVAAVGFALATLKLRGSFSGAIGAKVMFLAAVIGLVVAIVTIVKPEKAA